MLRGQTFHFSLRKEDTGKMEQQATGRSDCSSVHGLSEGPENWKAAGNVDSEGHADEVPVGKENRLGNWNRDHPCFPVAESLASLCPCPEACWNIELPRARPVHVAEEIAKQQSVQAAVWLLLMAYSQMKEQRDRLKVKYAKKKAELKGQRMSQRHLKKKGFPEEALSKETKAEKLRLSVGNPGKKEDSSCGHQKTSPKHSGKSSLPAKGSSKSAEIPRGHYGGCIVLRPGCYHYCTGDCKGLKKRGTETGGPSPQLKPRESSKVAFNVESLCKEYEAMMHLGPAVVKPQRKHKKTPAHEAEAGVESSKAHRRGRMKRT